ncbi:hypothetical protein WJX77_000708 [Trebouxia sp. C0004]
MQGSRWSISNVKVRAFKSVGKTHLEVDLSSGLTCIIGPNGSGKSNFLDAVCFACGCSAAALGVQRLADLQCTDAQEVCEVSFNTINNTDGRTHTIRCELVPDSGRVYRLDGKLRSVKEVKTFLKDRGINLDQSCCLIRQAHVTRLADNNNHQQLAALIHDTSGYTRWSNEASAALEELKKTKKALQEISGNVKCLEAGVAEDEVKYGAAARLAQLDGEVVEVQQDMATCLHARRSAVTQDVLAAQAQLATLQKGLASQADKLAKLQQQDRQLQEPRAAAHTHDDQKLRTQRHIVAAAEEEVKIIQMQCVQAQQAVRQLEEAQAASSDLQSQLARLQQSMRSQQQFVTSLEATIAGTNPGDMQQAAELQKQHEQIQQQIQVAEQQLEAALTGKADSKQQLLSAQQGWDRAAAILAALPGTDVQVTADAASTRGTLQQMDKALKQARQHSEECCRQAEMQKLALGSSMMLTQPGSTVPRHRMLHDCFKFKQPSSPQLEALMEALHILTGDKLSIALVESATAASELVASHGQHSHNSKPLRVWDLQRLQAYDKVQQQKQAQASFAPGSVIIPLELLEYDTAYQGAMVRAFGGCVIAQDDATAGELVTQNGLPCITLDGKISRPGSMQGGWRGQAQGSTGPIAKKVKADQLQVAATVASSRLQEAAAAAQKAQHQLASLESSVAAFAEAQQEVSLLQQQVSALSKAAAAKEQRHIQCKSAVADLHERLKQSQQVLDACACTDGTALKVEHLQDQLRVARLKASEMQQKQEDLAAKADEASDQVILATEQIEDLNLTALEQQLQSKRDALQGKLVALQELQASLLHPAKTALQAKANAETNAQLAAIAQQQKDISKAAQGQRQQVQAAQRSVEDLQRQKDQGEAELQSLLNHVPELRDYMTRKDAVTQSSRQCQLQDPTQPIRTDAAGHAKQLRQMHSKCKKLKEERSSNKAQQMPAHEQVQFQSRKTDLNLFKERAEALQQAVVVLEEGIATSRAQVVQTDEAVFETIQDKFVALTANLLPKLELKVERVAQQVHQGLQFMYRSTSDKMAGWRCDLGRLSGGERTLVSLALILAAATAGAKSCLFLMDEVDAALDESNQALVATLIKEIMAQSGGCQILCVTHNLAFQQTCSSIIQVAKDKHGATIVLDSASGS